MGGDGRRLLRVSTRVNGTRTASESFHIPTALLAKREAIAADESGEVWEVPLMELRASSMQIQRAKPKLAEPGRLSGKSSRALGGDAHNSTEPTTIRFRQQQSCQAPRLSPWRASRGRECLGRQRAARPNQSLARSRPTTTTKTKIHRKKLHALKCKSWSRASTTIISSLC